MENKLFKLEELCKPKDRTEVYCMLGFYLEMNKIHCPYNIKNENTILDRCNYRDSWNKIVHD
jgi:hypothetical protein